MYVCMYDIIIVILQVCYWDVCFGINPTRFSITQTLVHVEVLFIINSYKYIFDGLGVYLHIPQ